MGEHVARMAEVGNTLQILVWKHEGKIPHWRCVCRREGYIKIGLKETVCGGVNRINLPQDKVL
jgi:hypothetical protein